MITIKRYFFYLPFIFSLIYSNNLKVKPIIYTLYSSNGSDWVYEKKTITSFGTGLGIEFNNRSWSIMVDYLQLGFLGEINHGLYEYSSKKGLPYIDKSKDADGYWSEYVKAKVTYELNTIKVHLGIFDRQWGFGKNAIHISKKAPSYPQFGFDWKINDNLSFIYFHGFLNSGIPDSSQSIHYNNEISQRTFNISRNIASHRIQFTPIKNLELGFNESVIYATRDIDIHYLIPFAPFYPIENYLGDTDNIQMGFDLCLKIKNKQRLYFGFFMDELTPEWIFNSKNHNWFAYQLGYNKSDLIFQNSYFTLEYNWTDQRIYKHKYEINDFYSHGEPLGFWAGPHAEELLFNYFFELGDYDIEIDYSYVKRGLVSRLVVDDNYNDTHNQRYSDGFSSRDYYSCSIKRDSRIKGLKYILGINQNIFDNIRLTDDSNYTSSNKLSLELGIFYNFNYNH